MLSSANKLQSGINLTLGKVADSGSDKRLRPAWIEFSFFVLPEVYRNVVRNSEEGTKFPIQKCHKRVYMNIVR